MNMPVHDFTIGNLVRARGREWVVQPDSAQDWLRLRPLGGADNDIIAVDSRARVPASRTRHISVA